MTENHALGLVMAQRYLAAGDDLARKVSIFRAYLTRGCAGSFNPLFSGDGFTYTGGAQGGEGTSRGLISLDLAWGGTAGAGFCLKLQPALVGRRVYLHRWGLCVWGGVSTSRGLISLGSRNKGKEQRRVQYSPDCPISP